MKKILSLVLALALLLGCASALAEGFTTDFDVPATGEPFVIYAWNDEFLGMLKNYYLPAVEIGDVIDKVIRERRAMLEEDPLFVHPAELKQLLEEYEPIDMSLRPAPIVLHLDGLRVKIPYREHKAYFESLEVYGRKLTDIARISESKIDDSSTIIRIKTRSEVEDEDRRKR